jgi:signal transduction histidine kinase
MERETSDAAYGSVDRDGRLVSADRRLLALQISAGGAQGGFLAIPQLANLARMARSLGILVSRSVVAADGALDLDLWVNARPEGDMITLSVSGWKRREQGIVSADTMIERERDFAVLEADGAWQIDADFIVTALSPELITLIGGATAQSVGMPITRLVRLIENESDDLPLVLATMQRRPFVGQLAELRDMPHVQLVMSGIPKFDADAAFAGYNGNYRLIDRQLVAVRSEVVPSTGVDDQFTKRLDAALRGPLAKIIADADEIGEVRSGPLRHNYVTYANDISSAGRHLLGLVDDLVDLQAVELPGFRIETESVDLADLARRASGLLRVRAGDNGVRIDPPHTDESVMAQGDFRRVLQIMVNLLSNAVRYSPQGSQIWLRTEQEGDLAAVIVADQGKGISAEDQLRIFDKFERVDPSEPGGSGLGLYISRRLARAMGGDISVDSAPGRGARFVLTLPSA